MLNLPYYGVPQNYKEHVSDFLNAKEIIELYNALLVSELSPHQIVHQFKDHGYFPYALGKAAWENNLALLIPIVYSVEGDDRIKVHFEWKIPHSQFELTFSNAFFIVFFNELYLEHPDMVGRKLADRGIALRALSYLSYTPWNNFLLPINQNCVEHFLQLPLYDRDNDYYNTLKGDAA